MIVSLVAAVAGNGVIGRDGGLPWRLATDLKRFKAVTMGKPVIMGRRTWESFDGPLPGRRNIVVTRDAAWRAPGAETAPSIEAALAAAARVRADEACVIGGGEIFRQAIERADRLYVTHVLAQVEGDVFFPAIDPAIWVPGDGESVPAGEKDVYPTRYVVYERR